MIVASLLSKWLLSLMKLGHKFIRAIFLGLFQRWGVMRRKWCFWLTLNRQQPQSPPVLPSGNTSQGYSALEDDKSAGGSHRTVDAVIEHDVPYTTFDDGETISLDRVARSVHPFPGGSIRTVSQSSLQLQESGRTEIVSVVANWKSLSTPQTYNNMPPELESNTSLPSGGFVFPRAESPTYRQLCLAHISPTIPEATQRYSKRPIVNKRSDNITIPPLTSSYCEPRTPSGWMLCDHPEGARYFYHQEKRIFTDADLFNNEIVRRATEDVENIEEAISDLGSLVPPNRHLVIDLTYVAGAKDGIQTVYYFVDHDARKVFFLDPFQAEAMTAWWEARGCNSMKHLGIEMEAQYWYFVNLYPDSIPLSLPLIGELRDMSHHYIGDSVTFPQSIAPFTLEYLEKILIWTSSMERNLSDGVTTIGTTSLLSRLLYSFYHARYLHFYGEAHARLERDISVYGSTNQRTWFIRVFSLLLFWAPNAHHQTLQKMWMDGILSMSHWEDSMKELAKEWEEYVFLGTLLLNGSVGFLAIQTIDDRGSYRSGAEIASYLSIVASIGSIILGLLLLRQNRQSASTYNALQYYLSSMSHPIYGLELVAILQSLPYALLMWALIAFFAAFSFSSFGSTNTVTRAITGSVAGVVAVMVCWLVWLAWEAQFEANAQADSRLPNDRPISAGKKSISNFARKMLHISIEMTPRVNIRRPTQRREAAIPSDTS